MPTHARPAEPREFFRFQGRKAVRDDFHPQLAQQLRQRFGSDQKVNSAGDRGYAIRRTRQPRALEHLRGALATTSLLFCHIYPPIFASGAKPIQLMRSHNLSVSDTPVDLIMWRKRNAR